MGWRGFGFVHRSRTLFHHEVPNPSLTIRHFFIAVPHRARRGGGAARSPSRSFRWTPWEGTRASTSATAAATTTTTRRSHAGSATWWRLGGARWSRSQPPRTCAADCAGMSDFALPTDLNSFLLRSGLGARVDPPRCVFPQSSRRSCSGVLSTNQRTLANKSDFRGRSHS
jgi:hypothetical protein